MTDSVDSLNCNLNCIFIYQVALARRQRRDLFGLRVKLPPAHLSTTRGAIFTLSLLMLNAKQESCENYFLVFGLTPPEIEPNKSTDRESNPILPTGNQTLGCKILSLPWPRATNSPNSNHDILYIRTNVYHTRKN